LLNKLHTSVINTEHTAVRMVLLLCQGRTES